MELYRFTSLGGGDPESNKNLTANKAENYNFYGYRMKQERVRP